MLGFRVPRHHGPPPPSFVSALWGEGRRERRPPGASGPRAVSGLSALALSPIVALERWPESGGAGGQI